MDLTQVDPLLLAGLAAATVMAWHYQRGLTWTEYRTLHELKILLAPIIDRRTGIFILSHKGYREDTEYLLTIDGPVRDVWRGLIRAGASPHLINSIKVRETPEGVVQYSQAHVVWKRPDTDGDGQPEQVEAFIFDNSDGTVDIYSHVEGSVINPEDHLTGEQYDGDPYGVVRDALGLS